MLTHLRDKPLPESRTRENSIECNSRSVGSMRHSEKWYKCSENKVRCHHNRSRRWPHIDRQSAADTLFPGGNRLQLAYYCMSSGRTKIHCHRMYRGPKCTEPLSIGNRLQTAGNKLHSPYTEYLRMSNCPRCRSHPAKYMQPELPIHSFHSVDNKLPLAVDTL